MDEVINKEAIDIATLVFWLIVDDLIAELLGSTYTTSFWVR